MTTSEAATTTRKPVKPAKFDQPIWVTFDQSATTNVFEVFEGKNAEQRARDHASDKAKRLDRPVAVFGPQVAVKVPPVPVTAGDMDLSFT